ncbi:MAG: aminopeptidase P N-terminal domain-containing protein [Candidatus Marinimicrobia bacterium]|nr:aminopeptidase P N-terminal domain-containing protein [Candidatus Neomarinimicrobiota bacterium]MCF7851539.1 aminopeptidase P N-terminal domain-containing protein [Candidatus Neomarinimicrobiota bacterium]MCF7905398.1 aminopeptidase P N-terminal domain-containing protein [Candidatus Neomarinimicrobiota bacterium]
MSGMTVYKRRRDELIKKLGRSVAIVKGAPEQTRSHDTEYPYRQDSDFFYLTGYTEPGAACIIDPNNQDHPFQMFVLPQDPKKEVWTGWRLSFEETEKKFGCDRAADIAEFENSALESLKKATKVYTNLNHNKDHHHTVLEWLQQVRKEVQRSGGGPEGIESLGAITHEMRLIKDAHEVELMEKAAQISADAHIRAMQASKPGIFEYQLQAVLEHHFVYEGGAGPAYTSIVGAGDNATVLHYVKNADEVKDGDMILIDAAAEYQMYAADITRTFPANGTFTKAQRELYDVVLKAQKAVIEAAKPGVPYKTLHELDLKLLVEGMLEIGLLEGSYDEIIEEKKYQDYFMHNTGHWLGLDVHDMGKYMVDGESRSLEPGMVFTVEPGIYVNSRSDAPERFRGIGVRIEDNILITEEGNRNLTDGVPKEVDEIEALMGRK